MFFLFIVILCLFFVLILGFTNIKGLDLKFWQILVPSIVAAGIAYLIICIILSLCSSSSFSLL